MAKNNKRFTAETYSRIELYKWLLFVLDSNKDGKKGKNHKTYKKLKSLISPINDELYNGKESENKYKAFEDELSDLLRLHISVLEDIEPYFLDSFDDESDESSPDVLWDYFDEGNKRYISSIFKDYETFEYSIYDRIAYTSHSDDDSYFRYIDGFLSLQKQFKANGSNEKWYKKKESREAFMLLLMLLNEKSNLFFEKTYSAIFDKHAKHSKEFYESSKKGRNFSFLSYAFVDRLYTFSLFWYGFSWGATLFVDWLFNEPFSNGVDIKNALHEELIGADQLLFLRSPHSELGVDSRALDGKLEIAISKYIRPWCAWEMGNFYMRETKGDKETFYKQIYKQCGSIPTQLDGISQLIGIKSGKMF